MKLYVITNSNFMADFIFDEFKDDSNVVHIQFKERKNPFTAILKWIRLKLGNPRRLFNNFLFDRDFLKDISQIGLDDKVLLWSIENLKTTILMAREINSSNIISFLWNPMFRLRKNMKQVNLYTRTIKEYGIRLSTFDQFDSNMLKCRLMPQVHRAINMPKIKSPEFDVFFVGQLKGRETTLSILIKEFKINNISYHFHLVYGNHYKADIDEDIRECIKDELMTYQDTLTNINRSKCLLDLTQNGQRGLTLRPIEALIYKKKLITNNPAIKEEPFYNPNNIWIIGDPVEKRSIVEFLNNIPYVPIPYELEQHCHIRNWLVDLWENEITFDTSKQH